MKIKFNTTTLAKKAAKRLKTAFDLVEANNDPQMNSYHESKGIDTIEKTTLSKAQLLTANMLGYRDWHELEQTTKSSSVNLSLPDEDIDEAQESERIEYQFNQLKKHYNSHLCQDIAYIARVSAKSPNSPKLNNGIGTQNEIVFDKEEKKWRFYRSIRSDLFSINIDDIHDGWSSGYKTDDELLSYAEEVLTHSPESHNAIWIYLCAITKNERLRGDNSVRTSELEKTYLSWLPEEFLKAKNKSFEWHCMEDRDFLRVSAMFAHTFYLQREFKKSHEWFARLSEMTDVFDEGYKDIIKDNSSASPKGTFQ
jgi:hypothetical protein